MKLTGRLALGLGAVNLATLILVAAVSADDTGWAAGQDRLPPDALPVSEIARRVEDQGVSHITRIETDGKSYRVRGLDQSGHHVERRIDPVSGTEIR